MKLLTDGLGLAGRLADDQAGKKPVQVATSSMEEWKSRHAEAREADNAGDYQGALDKVIGARSDKPTWECFDNVDQSLDLALKQETKEFRQSAGDGRGALSGLPAGAAVLAVLAAAAALIGVGRRLSEYR